MSDTEEIIKPSVERLSVSLVEESTKPETQKSITRDAADRFVDVLHTCVRTVSTSNSRSNHPICHTALTSIHQDDVEAFQTEYPKSNNLLEEHVAKAMSRIEDDDMYRSIGLYVALLARNIDLIHTSNGILSKGKVGETCTKFSALVRQAFSVRDELQVKKHVPTWAIVSIGILSIVVLVMIIAIAVVVLAMKKENNS